MESLSHVRHAEGVERPFLELVRHPYVIDGTLRVRRKILETILHAPFETEGVRCCGPGAFIRHGIRRRAWKWLQRIDRIERENEGNPVERRSRLLEYLDRVKVDVGGLVRFVESRPGMIVGDLTLPGGRSAWDSGLRRVDAPTFVPYQIWRSLFPAEVTDETGGACRFTDRQPTLGAHALVLAAKMRTTIALARSRDADGRGSREAWLWSREALQADIRDFHAHVREAEDLLEDYDSELREWREEPFSRRQIPNRNQ